VMELRLAGRKNTSLHTMASQLAVIASPKPPFCSIRH
jgi:hypothetical protein